MSPWEREKVSHDYTIRRPRPATGDLRYDRDGLSAAALARRPSLLPYSISSRKNTFPTDNRYGILIMFISIL